MDIFFKKLRMLWLVMFIFIISVSFSGCAWVPFWGDEDEDEEVELESEIEDFEDDNYGGAGVDDLKSDIQTLHSQQEDSQIRLEELEDKISSMPSGGSGESATNSAEIEDLKDTIHKLQSQIGDLKDNIHEMEFDAKLRSSQRPRTVSRGSSRGGGVKRGYDKALQLFNLRQYDESLRKFKSLDNRRTPANLRDNVVFWTGQCYLKLEDFENAIEKFNTVVDEYGSGNKVVDSMYGIGVAYSALGEKSKALDYLEQALSSGPSRALQRKIEAKMRELEG